MITVAAIGLTCALGLWQLDRAEQKRAMAEHLRTQSLKPLLQTEQLPAIARSPDLFFDQRIQLRGRWLPQHTIALDNRQMRQQVGFYVVTPLVLSSPGAPVVLVQRGWIPRNIRQREALPAVITPSDEVVLQGRIARRLSQAYALGSDAKGLIRQNLDIAAYANEISTPLLPFVIIQINDDSPPGQEGLQRDWPSIDHGVEKHLGYAVQWFLLAGLIGGLYLWLGLIAPRLRRAKAAHLTKAN